MSFVGGGGGAGGATEALAYFIRAYDMATPVFRAFGAEVEATTKQVQASMAAMNRELALQNKTVAESAATQEAALGKVKTAQAGAADASMVASDEQVKAARAAAAAADEQAVAAQRAAEMQVKAAETASAAVAGSAATVSRMGRNITLALIGASAASLDFATKFQSNTLRMETQAGATVTQLGKLRTGLLQMAGQVGSTPDQLATGLYHVVSSMNAIIPPAQRVKVELNIMKAAAEGAQIGGSNLEDTAYALSSAMNALHQSTGNAYKVMGVLNATVGAGDMTLQDLIDSFKSGLIPAADSFGVSITSVGAALAVMGDMGMRGALAGTRLRMALSLMAAPTKQAAGILETLGMSSKQALASTKAMSDALQQAGVHTTTLTQDLRKPDGIAVALNDLDAHLKSSGLSADAAGAAISRAFGGGRMGAAITLLAENTNRLALKFDYINQKSNQFGHDWQTTLGTFRVQVDKALAAVEALGIGLGDKLMPYATDALHMLENMAHWLLANQTAMEILAGTIITFSTVAIGAYFFSKLRGALGLIKDMGVAMKGLGRWIFGMGPAPTGAGPAAEIGTAITESSAKAATAMSNAITTSNAAAITKLEDAMVVSSSKAAVTIGDAITAAGLRTAAELQAGMGLGGTTKAGAGGLLAAATGKLWGFMGSDIMVGTARNPIAVTLAGGGLAGGAMNATQAAEEQAAGIGPAAVTTTTVADQQAAQMSLFGAQAEKAAQATAAMESQMSLFSTELAGMSLPSGLATSSEQLSLAGLANRVPAATTVAAAVPADVAALEASSVAGLAGLKTTIGGLGTSLKSSFTGFGSSLLRGGVLAGIGTMISQMVGDMIKGSAGGWVKSLGTGASIGAGAGIIIPGLGPAVGAAVGTAVAAALHTGLINNILHPPGPGQQVTDQLTQPFGGTRPGTGGIPAPNADTIKAIAGLFTDAAHQAFTPGYQTGKATPVPGGLARPGSGASAALVSSNNQPIRHPMTPLEAQRFEQDMFQAGALAAGSLEKGWNQYKFESEPIMFRQLEGAIWKFPPQAQASAAESAIKFSQTLEKEKRLPVGATQNLVDDIRARFPALVQYMGTTAKSALQAWSQNFDLNKWQMQLKTTLSGVGQQFAGVGYSIANTSGTIQQKTQAAIAQLRLISMSPLSSPAEQAAAKRAILNLTNELDNTWTAAARTASAKGHDMLTTIINYTTQSAQVAAANMNLSDAQKNLDASTQNIINTIQTQWSVMRGVTATTATNMTNNMDVAFTTLEHIANTKTGQAKTEALINLKLLQTNATTYMQTLQSQTVLDIGKMSQAIINGSQTAAALGVKQFSYFASQVQSLMQSGVISTGAGMAAITRALVASLQALGSNVKASDLKGESVSGLTSFYKYVTTGQGAAPTAGAGFHATGGRVPGPVGPDNWMLVDPTGRPTAMVGGAELLIANRHTEARLDQKLAMGAAAGMWNPTSVAAEVAGETTPHSFALGGLARAGFGGSYSAGNNTGTKPASYVFPFPKGEPFSWNRIDQGQDLQGPPGGPVLAIGPGNVTVGSDVFSGFGPFYPILSLSAGPWAGRSVYYGHAKDTVRGPVRTGEVIGVTQTTADTWTAAPAGWLEFGFTTALGQGIHDQGAAVAPMLHALAAGHMVAGSGGLGATWTPLKMPKWGGPGGLLGQVGQLAIKTYLNAANKYGEQQAAQLGGGFGGAIGTSGIPSKPGFTITGPVSTFGPPGDPPGTTASGRPDTIPGISLRIPGTNYDDPRNRGLMNHMFRVSIQGHSANLMDIDLGPNQSTGRDIDVTGAGVGAMGFPYSNFPTNAIGTATLLRALGGRVPFAGAYEQGGMVTVNQPTMALFGENGRETAIFLPNQGTAASPGALAQINSTNAGTPTSTSYGHGSGHTSTGKPESSTSTSSTQVVGNNEVTTTIHTHTGPGGTSSYTTTTTRPVHYTTGLNPLTDRIETHTSQEWSQIHAQYEQQRHDAALAKQKYDKWLAGHVTDMLTIGGLPAGFIEISRKLAKQEHFPLGAKGHGANLSLLKIDQLDQEGWTKVKTALHTFLGSRTTAQLMGLSGTMAHELSSKGSPLHHDYREYRHDKAAAEKRTDMAQHQHKEAIRRYDELIHHSRSLAEGAKQNRAAAKQDPAHRTELMRLAHKDHEEAMKLHREAKNQRDKHMDLAHKDAQDAKTLMAKANEIGSKIATSRPGQVETAIITAATKSIMAGFTDTQHQFQSVLSTLGLLEKVPPGSTAHSLGLTHIQLKALGLRPKDIKQLAGGDSGTGLSSPRAYLDEIKVLTHKEIPAYQRESEQLAQEYRNALKDHNTKLAKTILANIDKVTQAQIQASADMATAQTNLIEARYEKAQTAISNIQTKSDILGSIQNLSPGTSLASIGLTHSVLKSMGFSKHAIAALRGMEGSSSQYIQELEQEQGGKLTATQISRFKTGIAAQNRLLAQERKKDVGSLDQLEHELPHLRGTARTTAETHIRDLAKNILDLTGTMRDNNKAVSQLTKATVANTTATGTMTGSVGFSYQNQDYVAGGSQTSESLVNVNLG